VEQLINLVLESNSEILFIEFNYGELLSASGAFLVGLGALISALFSLRGAKKKASDDCDKRIEDIRAAFKKGTEYEQRQARISKDLSDWGGK
jgi:hypothetical protein